MAEDILGIDVKKIFREANAIITGEHFVYAKKPDGWYHGPDYVNKDAIYPYESKVATLCHLIALHFSSFGIKSDTDIPWKNVQVVVGPTVGGVALSWVTTIEMNDIAASQGLPRFVQPVFADEEDVLEFRSISRGEICIHVKEGCLRFTAAGDVEISLFASEFPEITNVTFFRKIGTRRIIKRGYDKVVKGKRCLIVEDIINSGATVQKTRVAVEEAGGIVVGVGALCNRSGGKVTAKTLGVPEFFSLLDLDMVMYKEEECPICKEKGPQSVRTDLGKGKEFLQRIGKAI